MSKKQRRTGYPANSKRLQTSSATHADLAHDAPPATPKPSEPADHAHHGGDATAHATQTQDGSSHS